MQVKVTGQVTGHRSGYRSQATGQVTGQTTGHRSGHRSDHRSHTKTIGHWTKLFLTGILLYKPRNLNYIFSVLNFTKSHT